jgi:hypothetical protein
MPEADLNETLAAAGEVGLLQAEAASRISALASSQIALMLSAAPALMPRAVVDRVLTLYEHAGSFGSANATGRLLVQLARRLSRSDIERVFAATANPDVSGSFGLPEVLSAIRNTGQVSPEEWDALMRKHTLDRGFEYLMYERATDDRAGPAGGTPSGQASGGTASS